MIRRIELLRLPYLGAQFDLMPVFASSGMRGVCLQETSATFGSRSCLKKLRLTILGRSVLLIVSELVVNAICWTAAGLLFGRHSESSGFLSLAVLAWVRIKFANVTACLLVL